MKVHYDEKADAIYLGFDESKIVESLTALRDRIENQFPDSGLGRVADELIAVAAEVSEVSARTGGHAG